MYSSESLTLNCLNPGRTVFPSIAHLLTINVSSTTILDIYFKEGEKS